MADGHTIHPRFSDGFAELTALWARFDALEDALETFSDDALDVVDYPIEQVLEKLRAFEPSVSIIGQVKAGKSTLLNALIGQPDFLPSDVNPWTSVITALHLNSRHRPYNTRALFRFFDQHEWDRLVATGGRLGEMADRAGFEHEAEEVRAQVTEMRAGTEARLGDAFDRLIGGSHAFPEIEKDLIDRYICYGDPDDLADGATEGVYADLTKTADLYIDLPHLPKGLCLRDTPGVNDTFMMREQITLNAISDSRVCVIVLSAHQALSTMDLALLRIICSVEAREVLIFVNRIDELPDRLAEQKNIRASILKTLERQGLETDIEILFGSGYWANFALRGEAQMVPASLAALTRLHHGTEAPDAEQLRRRAMAASGIPALHKAIAKRVVEGPGEALLKDVQSEIDMIIEMSEVIDDMSHRRAPDRADITLNSMDLALKLADQRDAVLRSFDAQSAELRLELRTRLERTQENYIASALTALGAHIATFGEIGAWNHDPSGLRMMMKTAFTSSCAKLKREGEAGFDRILAGVQDILETDLGVARNASVVEFPEQPQHRAPTILAQLLSLDLQGPWWRKYWRFGSMKSAENRYRAVIAAETTPLIDGLMTEFFDPAVTRTREIIEQFAMNQGAFCKAVYQRCADASATGTDEPAQLRRRSA